MEKNFDFVIDMENQEVTISHEGDSGSTYVYKNKQDILDAISHYLDYYELDF